MVPNKRNFDEIRTPCSNQSSNFYKKVLILTGTESEIFSDFMPISHSYEGKIPTIKLVISSYT